MEKPTGKPISYESRIIGFMSLEQLAIFKEAIKMPISDLRREVERYDQRDERGVLRRFREFVMKGPIAAREYPIYKTVLREIDKGKTSFIFDVVVGRATGSGTFYVEDV